jgi:hypothetical protein
MSARPALAGLLAAALFLSGCHPSLYDQKASEQLSTGSPSSKTRDIKSIWCYYTPGQREIGPLVDYTKRSPTLVIDDPRRIQDFMVMLLVCGKMPAGVKILHPGALAMVIFFSSGGKPAYFHCYLWRDKVLTTPLLPEDESAPAFPFYRYIVRNYPALAGESPAP